MSAAQNITKSHHKYDIRGTLGSGLLSKENVICIGYNIAKYLPKSQQNGKIVIGHDTRESSKNLLCWLSYGIKLFGSDVICLQFSTTPFLRYACRQMEVDGGVMITASHNQHNYNGFKIFHKNGLAISEDGLQEVSRTQNIQNILQCRSEVGNSDELINNCNKQSCYQNQKYYCRCSQSSKTISINNANVRQSYIKILSNIVPQNKTKKLKILWDCGYGGISFIIKDIVDSLEHDSVITNLANGYNFNKCKEPDACKGTAYKSASKLIQQQNIDIGFLFDCDADRLIILDRKGQFVTASKVMKLLIDQLDASSKIAVDTKSDFEILDYIAHKKHEAVVSRCGYSFFQTTMQSTSAIMGFEQSHHFFFKEFCDGIDDAIFCAHKVLQAIITNGINIADYNNTNESGNVISLPQRKWHVDRTIGKKVIENIIAILQMSKWNIIIDNGVRVHEEEFWFLLRMSNTENYVMFCGEARTKEFAEMIINFVDLILTPCQQNLSAKNISEMSSLYKNNNIL